MNHRTGFPISSLATLPWSARYGRARDKICILGRGLLLVKQQVTALSPKKFSHEMFQLFNMFYQIVKKWRDLQGFSVTLWQWRGGGVLLERCKKRNKYPQHANEIWKLFRMFGRPLQPSTSELSNQVNELDQYGRRTNSLSVVTREYTPPSSPSHIRAYDGVGCSLWHCQTNMGFWRAPELTSGVA